MDLQLFAEILFNPTVTEQFLKEAEEYLYGEEDRTMEKELWQIFKLKGKEIARYPIRDAYPGKVEEMRVHLAEAHGCSVDKIKTEIGRK